MAGEHIAVGIIIGIFTGGLIGFFIVSFKRRSQVKNSIENIRNQKTKFMLDGKPYNFIGSIDEELKKSGIEEDNGFFKGILPRRKKKNKDNIAEADDEKEKRPTKKSKKKENKKHPYKKKR